MQGLCVYVLLLCTIEEVALEQNQNKRWPQITALIQKTGSPKRWFKLEK